MLVRPVQILQLCKRGGGVQGGFQLGCELALAVNGLFDRLATLVQSPKILQPALKLAQGGVVHRAVELLAVTGDKGDGIALVEQTDDVFNVLFVPAQLPGQGRDDIHG